jgi:flagellar hook-basal body complex protein FliE
MPDPLGLIPNSQPITPAARPTPPGGPAGPGQADGPGFRELLQENLQQVNQLQQDAELAIEDLVSGRRTDMDGVMLAKQKADVAFSMLLQVRNKMMDAYEEVKQIRV